jgi:hypothetical protein
METESAKSYIQRKKRKLNQKIKMKDITRLGNHYFLTEAATYLIQHNNNEKVFVLERLKWVGQSSKFDSKSRLNKIEFRIGYFVIGKIGKSKGKRIWGQFSPLLPKKDFNQLINKAKRERERYKLRK